MVELRTITLDDGKEWKNMNHQQRYRRCDEKWDCQGKRNIPLNRGLTILNQRDETFKERTLLNLSIILTISTGIPYIMDLEQP